MSTLATQLGVLPGVSVAPPVPVGAAPLLKWAGGKRWILPLIGDGIFRRLHRTGGRYFEPFLGGGAVALHLGVPEMVLGDVLEELITCYTAVRRWPAGVAQTLMAFAAQGVDESSYYKVRDLRAAAPGVAAARMIYLNRLGYNGLYRVNRAGEFNVPYGHHARYGRSGANLLPSQDAIAAVARSLRGAVLQAGDFERMLSSVGAGDVVFCDPPYYGTFSGYSVGGFGHEEQARLARVLRKAAARRAVVITTNTDCAEVRDLYSWAEIVPTAELRRISCKRGERQRARAVLITSDTTILGS